MNLDNPVVLVRVIQIPDETKTKKPLKDDGLPEKEFMERPSLLTSLQSNRSCSSLYHLLIALGLLVLLGVAASDIYKGRSVDIGFALLKWNFNDVPFMAVLWLTMQCTTFIVYFFYSLWARVRLRLHHNCLRRLWDLSFFCSLVSYQIVFLALPCHLIMQRELHVVGTIAMLVEQCRFAVKLYTFLRNVLPRVVCCEDHHEDCRCVVSFKCYVYYMMVPTLIYQDEYPRTPAFRPSFFLHRFLECFLLVFLSSVLLDRLILPSLRDFTSLRTRPWQLLSAILTHTPAFLFLFLATFMCICHSGFNALAELTRFGDRLSYKDWWNASSYPYFFRTWNLLIQDWLYMQVYRDSYKNLLPDKRLATLLVFIVSGILHDFVASMSFRFFYPVFLILLGILGPFLLVIPRIRGSYAYGNMWLWLSLGVGMSCLCCLYLAEYYSRVNCPRTIESAMLDFFVPRSWTCDLP